MIKFAIVGSGSKGNAAFVYSEKTIFQIDMGLPLCRTNAVLKKIGRSLSEVKALFLTHEHSDHIKAVSLYHGLVPIYAGEGVYPSTAHFLKHEESLEVGDFILIPLQTSHDAVDPFGFAILNGSEKLVYMTDTGFIPEGDLPYMENADHYIIESNHDEKMLLASSRPPFLKKRIKGKKGHLSNKQAALGIAKIIGDRTKSITLAHLSEECNTPSLALKTWRDIFEKKGLSLCKISYASQTECLFGGDL